MRPLTALLLATATTLLLFMISLAIGSVNIPLSQVATILMGGEVEREAWRHIILESRLPAALTALLSGAALAASGLMLQTLFRNPLADPSIFGICSGAGLGAASVMLAMGGSLSLGLTSMGGYAAVMMAAFLGALAVTGLLVLFSRIVKSDVMLLIVGIMIGYVAYSATSLMNYFATSEGVKSYMVWGLGSFAGVPLRLMPSFSILVLIGLFLTMMTSKSLNLILLGEAYAENLGLRVRMVRTGLIVITGILTSAVTALCGPIAFIGLAVPHMARLAIKTSDHRLLLPTTMLLGASVALLCSVLCSMPGRGGLLPINAVTSLLGAPVVVIIMLRHCSK